MNPLTKDEADAIRRSPPINLNIAEAAAYLCISIRKLWDEANVTRHIRVARIGSRLIFRREELDRWLSLLEAQNA